MTPARIIEVFKAIAEDYDCIFFAGATREFIRVTVEAEASQGETFVFLDLHGMSINDNYSDRSSRVRFTLYIIQRDNGDSVSQEADNNAPYPATQTIALDCYNTWVDIINTLRSDNPTDSNYLARYSDFSVTSYNVTHFIKDKMFGMFSGVFITVDAGGKIEC